MIARALFGIVALVLVLPPVDPYLDAVMRRQVEIQIPALALLGYLLARTRRPLLAGYNPLGLTGLAFAVAMIAFWMVPRSLDRAVLDETFDQLMHLGLLCAGAALAQSLPLAPLVLRMALGLYAVSMIAALGVVYTRYPGLICTVYSLAQQGAVGRDLLWLAPGLWVILCVWAAVRMSKSTE
jgi:hypothetical protein